MTKPNIPYILVLLILLVAFGFQVKDSFEKFITKRTTRSIETTPVKYHDFPFLTICPGYRGDQQHFHSYFKDNPKQGLRLRNHVHSNVLEMYNFIQIQLHMTKSRLGGTR